MNRGPVSYPYIATGRTYGDLTFDFVVSDAMAREWYDTSVDQMMPERMWCHERIRPGWTVVDAGAHHGMMSLLFSYWVGDEGRVIAYEPLPFNAEVIRRNAVLNGRNNIDIRTVGLSDEPKVLLASSNQGNIVVADRGVRTDHQDTHGIDVVRLDDDLDPDVRVDFLKLDVEGSDVQALRGARRVLEQRPLIDLELHCFLFEDPLDTLKEIFDLLDPDRYQFDVLPEIWGYVRSFAHEVDLEWVAGLSNPHVLATPRPT